MTKKEIFLLTIIFQKLGFNKKEIDKLITVCTFKKDTYNTIMKSLDRLKEYFIGEKKYDKDAMHQILKEGRIYGYSIDKIKQVEDVFKTHDYSNDEIKTIETEHPTILCHETSSLDKKLLFYNDIKIKSLIIANPRHLMQGLKLSYARHQFLSAKKSYEENKKDLFMTELRFISAYGVKNKTLITRYPVQEPYCLVKK